MREASLRIVETAIKDDDGVRFWWVGWDDSSGGNSVGSVYLDDTYQERIAPRLRDPWTVEEIYALERADIIDFLTMYPDARRRVVRMLGEIDASNTA